MSDYTRSITRFSPDGRLFQIDHAHAAVQRGTTVVATRSKDMIVIAVEKTAVAKLQDPHTFSKICSLDKHVMCAFAGLHADARRLIQSGQRQCQSHRLTYEDPISIENIARYIATLQLKNTQSGGARPYGVSTLICGFDDMTSQPHIYETLPSGTYAEWKARTIGRHDQTVMEYLEKHYKDDMTDEEAQKLAIGALLEVVENGSKNLEVAYMKRGGTMEIMAEEVLDALIESTKAK
ncbi:Family T1, proteasome alpha subunit, threonine peptidase [Trichomonas vaginalis G3]|uniref:Proteasome subunit alpha type n=1 Tax=Trichomonas vaginalis (strain ATCC PRA-98 / G3) TaxID=412133 RepID=A2DTN3_TRIV3|nr:threonine-type endopeptidase protein [Trichomonas vaginalis G3]EAY16180.1 Family T1, proteasome alpha subunit, threonine peptidase [Trichomonas vaginalis G3]KAI5493327.1 threonine-type endopeptidase protein [Trichomonas vaginalis G3]|eukprot:XP_001328403.1 Family T1, proteasome alpha subunit, threonine peptidase [Trichomonas vaginalis G3]